MVTALAADQQQIVQEWANLRKNTYHLDFHDQAVFT
jgi:hypothetical protein